MPETITSYTTFNPGTKAKSQEVNQNFSNHRGSILPIDPTTAAAVPNAYNVGSSEYPFKKAFLASGYWTPGDIKAHHSYNGALSPGHGWMLCDGRQITEANYNTEHGANTYATYVGTSTMLNLYLPNLSNKYLVGDTVTSQSGAATITSVGNTLHSVAHAHSIAGHNHQWLLAGNTSTNSDQSFSTGGAILRNIVGGTMAGNGIPFMTSSALSITNGQRITANQYTGNTPLTTQAVTQSIQPESIAVQYYMRII